MDKASEDESFNEAVSKSKTMKQDGKDILNNVTSQNKTTFTKVSFVCDAGMGSSAMGATKFKNQLHKLGIDDVEVKNYRIEDAPKDSDVLVVHKNLADRARQAHPEIFINK